MQDSAPLDVYLSAYEIFKTVADEKSKKSLADTRIISKGIKYMEENVIPDKSIAEISAMCGVSVGCFEKLIGPPFFCCGRAEFKFIVIPFQ